MVGLVLASVAPRGAGDRCAALRRHEPGTWPWVIRPATASPVPCRRRRTGRFPGQPGMAGASLRALARPAAPARLTSVAHRHSFLAMNRSYLGTGGRA
jgi:hypothetical protein